MTTKNLLGHEEEHKNLTRKLLRNERKIEQLQRNLQRSDKMWAASETVNNNLFNELQRTSKLLEAEKQRVEELLLTILPRTIKEELQANGYVVPKRYTHATVIFTDFADFTMLSEKRNPVEVVGRLKNYFEAFDDIVDHFGLEKLKTIGDGYMCAGGVPVLSETHAIDCVCAALEMLKATEMLGQKDIKTGSDPLHIRIGVHSGPLVAGVIGKKRFTFDVWGDTVNTASRVESAGLIDVVTISDKTYQMVKNQVEVKSLGLHSLKGKSSQMQLYKVLRYLGD